MVDDWYWQNLVCPRDHAVVRLEDGALCCEHGHRYPIISGIPVMLLDDVSPTLHVMRGSIAAAGRSGNLNADELFLETLGVDEQQRAAILECAKNPNLPIDPVVNYLVSHTNGLMYKHLVGKLQTYPIPELTSRPARERACWTSAAVGEGGVLQRRDRGIGQLVLIPRWEQYWPHAA